MIHSEAARLTDILKRYHQSPLRVYPQYPEPVHDVTILLRELPLEQRRFVIKEIMDMPQEFYNWLCE